MKKNSIIIASALSTIPFLFWGVKTIVKNPKFQRIVEDIKKEESKKVAETKKLVKEAVEPIKEEIKKRKSTSKRQRTGKKTIYEGAKGGHYTIGKNGKKLYIKNKT